MVGWLGVLAKEIQPRRRIYPAVSTDSSVLRPLLAQFFQLLAGVERLKGRAEGRSIVSETGCSLVYFMRAARQREGPGEWLVLGKTVLCTASHRQIPLNLILDIGMLIPFPHSQPRC
jgi:hypothetical protein